MDTSIVATSEEGGTNPALYIKSLNFRQPAVYVKSRGQFVQMVSWGGTVVFTLNQNGDLTITGRMINSYHTTTLVDFGGPRESGNVITPVAAPWIAADDYQLRATVISDPTDDHGSEDASVEGVQAYVTNIVAGVGFDLACFAPNNT